METNIINIEHHEKINVVFVGHVDHGKSTIIGRLLADSNSLPEGKLEQVKEFCKKSGKPFEYAFLLDALKDEQDQGITIDSARCFFKIDNKEYILIDAPGHTEFIKNMVTGASRADAAIIVIDAKEGIKENSKRHGFLVSFLGIRFVIVVINKMDMIEYSKEKFIKIKKEYESFLKEIGVNNPYFIPICARTGENIFNKSKNMIWYNNKTLYEYLKIINTNKIEEKEKLPFRFFLQGIYKFKGDKDNKRIFAGYVETGSIKKDANIIFLPSNKKNVIKTVESFNEGNLYELKAGESKGFTLKDEMYVKEGELVCKEGEILPEVGHTFKVNIFWLGKNPMVKEKKYKIKINASREYVYLDRILNIIDASELSTDNKKFQIDRFDVAECILKSIKPIAFDIYDKNQYTSRFVIIDNYEISGGGVILENIREKSVIEKSVEKREKQWIRSNISSEQRAMRYGHLPKFLVLTGSDKSFIENIAISLEELLYKDGKNAYFLGMLNLFIESYKTTTREDYILKIGDLARILTDAGMIFITVITDIDDYEIEILKTLNYPNKILIIKIGKSNKTDIINEEIFVINNTEDEKEIIKKIYDFLYKEKILLEYYL